MAANLPELTFRFPTLFSGAQAVSGLQIILDWSTDMETTQFSIDSERAKNVILMREVDSTIVDTSYVSYTAADRRLILSPASTLETGEIYRIFVKNRLLGTDGRRSFHEYSWTFSTASGSVSKVTLLNPPSYSVQPIFPILSWYGVSATSLITYTIEIDDRWDFNSLAYTAQTSGTSITPVGSFPDSTTYYWRVRASTSNATGAWSEIGNFYYGLSLQPDPSSRQSFPDTAIFGISSKGFTNGASHLSAHPNLTITFTSAPSSTYSSFITVVSKSVLPRNDDASSYDEENVAGSWSLSENTITFTPTEAISNNTRYEITLDPLMKSSDGYLLNQTYKYYWVGKYNPYYVSNRVIRSRFLGAEQQVPDDLINFYIHLASLEANARYYGYSQNPIWDTLGDSLSEATVRDSANLRSFGVLKWTESATAYKLLKAILFENLRDIGKTEKIGDGLFSLTDDFVKGIDRALDEVKQELDQWEEMLSPSSIPLTVSKSSRWHPSAWDYDWALMDLEGRRDNIC